MRLAALALLSKSPDPLRRAVEPSQTSGKQLTATEKKGEIDEAFARHGGF